MTNFPPFGEEILMDLRKNTAHESVSLCVEWE
jgi:hypothetical protein